MRAFLQQNSLTETTNNFWKLPIGVYSALKSLTEILLASTLKGQLCHDNKCNVATSNRNAFLVFKGRAKDSRHLTQIFASGKDHGTRSG